MASDAKVIPFEKKQNVEIEETIDWESHFKYEDTISRQFDTMQSITEQEREKVLKRGWIEEAEKFYNMMSNDAPLPSYRPRVTIPQLQVDLLHEASDLSDVNPIPYIVDVKKSERLKEREKAFQAQWRHSNYNLDCLTATIWSLISGNGYVQVSYDDRANNGQGCVEVTARHPGTTFKDPYSIKDEKSKWVIFEDWVYLDEVRLRFPDHGRRVRYRRPGPPTGMDWRLQMPPGPMSTIGGLPSGLSAGSKNGMDESRVRLRTGFVVDYSYKAGGESDVDFLPPPRRRLKYPGGRMIVECEGVVLFDSSNPTPGGMFPLVSFYGLPPLTSAIAPSPVSFTKDLQDLAERMYTQTFENAARLNNGITFIEEGTGIDIEEYGGIPAEVHMIATGAKAPDIKWPNALPAHMMDMPKTLLELQKEIQGFTPSRKGTSAAGNISAPLYDASVLMSQSLTRLRSKFLSQSFQRLGKLVFGMMGKFYTSDRAFSHFDGEEYTSIKWEGIGSSFDISDYEIRLDEASIEPYSQTSLRMLVPVLKQLGILDPQSALELLRIPNKEEIMERLAKARQEQAQADAQKQAAKGAKKK